jgi:prolyl-tRNA editing enzyme YbaK/EbsC (Cys-tRNA(Pro) deacylase)
MDPIRRADDDELLGYVNEVTGAWQALTVFGGTLGERTDRASAEQLVHERGMSSLADHWYYRATPTDAWQVVVLVEAHPGRVRIALDYYSMPGVPTVDVTAADLAAGADLTLEAQAMVTLDERVERAVNEHEIICNVLACDPELADTAAFCEHYGFSLDQSANTILVASKKVDPPRYAVCVVLGTTRLDVNKKVSELLGVKRLSFADADVTQELTGMMIGGVTAFGIDDLPIYVDAAVLRQSQVVMGGGNRSSKLLLAPAELLKLPNVEVIEDLAIPR